MSSPRPLIRADQIAARCRQLGRSIAHDHRKQPLVVVPLLGGAFCFVADLVRAIPLPDVRIEFARASSYGAGTSSSGTVELGEVPACADRHVLIVDDILDTGRTLTRVHTAIAASAPRSLRSCVLLDKPARRQVDIRADYVGFTIPDRFVVGYGLDYDGRYRHLPDVCELRPSPAS